MANLLEVQPDFLAAEKVFRPNLLELADLGFPLKELVEGGHGPKGHAARPAVVENAVAFLVRGRRNGDQDLLHTQRTAQRAKLVDGTDHLNVVDPHAALPGVVVDEPENVVLQHWTPSNLPEEHLARVPSAYDQGTPASTVAARVARLTHDPQRESHAPDQRQAQKPVDDQARQNRRAEGCRF